MTDITIKLNETEAEKIAACVLLQALQHEQTADRLKSIDRAPTDEETESICKNERIAEFYRGLYSYIRTGDPTILNEHYSAVYRPELIKHV